MAYKIVWLKLSIKRLEEIVKYLEVYWSKKNVAEFLNLINLKVLIISENPHI